MIYLVVFTGAVFFLYCAGRCRGALELILVLIGLFLPCFMAGMRDLTIGTDVMMYGLYTFLAAESSTLGSFLQSYSGISPVGFNLMSWFVSNVSHSFELYLGTIQALTIIPVYLMARYFFKHNEWLCILCYLLLLYPISLNIMKQSIAIALCFLSLVFVAKRRPLVFALTVIIAFLFHETAIFFLCVYPLFVLFLKSGSFKAFFGRWHVLILLGMVAIALMCVFIFGEQIILFVAQFKDSYQDQVSGIGTGSVNNTVMVMGCLSAAVWALCRKTVINSTGKIVSLPVETKLPCTFGYDLFFGLFLLGCILVQFSVISESSGRIGYYFYPLVGLFLSSLVFDTEKRGQYAAVILIIMLVTYFIFAFIVRDGGEIYPYLSSAGTVFW